jgi:hypothetical protein
MRQIYLQILLLVQAPAALQIPPQVSALTTTSLGPSSSADPVENSSIDRIEDTTTSSGPSSL